MRRILIIFLIAFLSFPSFSKDDMVRLNESIETFIAKKKMRECMVELNKQRAELFNCRVNLELEKIRRKRDIRLMEIKASKLVDRIYNFAFLAFIGFSFGIYAFKKQRDE